MEQMYYNFQYVPSAGNLRSMYFSPLTLEHIIKKPTVRESPRRDSCVYFGFNLNWNATCELYCTKNS